MALNTKVGSFSILTSDSGNKGLTGVGFRPQAVILHWNGTGSATDATAAGDLRSGFGVFNAAGEQAAIAYPSLDAQTSGTTAARGSTTLLFLDIGATATQTGGASFTSMDSDGFTINVSDAPSADTVVMYIAIGGSDIGGVKVGTYTGNVTTGNKSVTGVGFQPDALLLFNGGGGIVIPGSSGTRGGLAFGAATSSAQRISSWATDEGSATIDSGSYTYDGEMMALVGGEVDSIENRQSLVSFDADGFTFNQLEADTPGHIYLAIQGGRWTIGDLLTQTDTTTTVSESLPAQPQLIIFMSTVRPLSTQNTLDANGAMHSFGAATSASERMVMASQDENGIADSNVSIGVEYDAVYLNIATNDTVQGLGDVSRVVPNAFDFVMDDADPSQNYVWWIALGSSAPHTIVDIDHEPGDFSQYTGSVTVSR